MRLSEEFSILYVKQKEKFSGKKIGAWVKVRLIALKYGDGTLFKAIFSAITFRKTENIQPVNKKFNKQKLREVGSRFAQYVAKIKDWFSSARNINLKTKIN